jgi:hypothetical protein
MKFALAVTSARNTDLTQLKIFYNVITDVIIINLFIGSSFVALILEVC